MNVLAAPIVNVQKNQTVDVLAGLNGNKKS